MVIFHKYSEMFWNLVVNKYEQYQLLHIVMLVVLIIYSVVGAICFCALESPNERKFLVEEMENTAKKSALARDRLLYDMQYFFVKQINVSRLLSRELNTTLDYYDRLMGFNKLRNEKDINDRIKWNIWTGLYFAGTVCTTIGYGDIVTKTVPGKVFTVIYALIGIPLVITVLNIWGNGLFQLAQFFWHGYSRYVSRGFKSSTKKHMLYQDDDYDDEEDQNFIVESKGNYYEDADEIEEDASNVLAKLPMSFAITILIGWIFACAGLFSYLQEWNFFEAAYFFFISLTTIGFGDSTINHQVTCIYFLLILIGLAVVSMSISIIQLKIEGLFAKIIKSIDTDFKNLLTAERQKHSVSTSTDEAQRTKSNAVAVNFDENEGFVNEKTDVFEKYGDKINFSEKILMKMMSRHQHKMLNEKLSDRQKMRNVAVQTQWDKSSAAAQTDTEQLNAPAVAYYETDDTSSEETPPPAQTFSAMMAAAAGRRNASASGLPPRLTAQQRAGNGMLPTTSNPPRPHRSRGLTRKKLYIYNIGD